MVFVKLFLQQFKSLRLVHKGLVRRYERPFPILGKVDKVSYKIELPPRLKIHSVFHVSYLKPYHEDNDDPSQGFSKRTPTTVVTSYDKKGENIITYRVIIRRGVPPATELAGSQQMHYGNSRSRLSGSGKNARRGRLRLKWEKVSQDASNEPSYGLI
ncbi:hypothetical protein AAG906_009181 [Vitis piasezkii]